MTTKSKLDRKLESLGTKIAARESAKVYQFPLWGDPQRGVPNDLVRCALFTAAKGIDGQYNEDVPVFSQAGLNITYNGPSLTQDHLDVFEAIMHLARETPEGNTVCFTAHGLLKLIGRGTGKSDHDRLLRTLKHLTTTAITVKRKGYGTYCGSLLPEWADRNNTGKFSIRPNRDLIKLFERGFTVIEWQQRKTLARSPLAKHLQLWLSSHDDPHPVTVQYLRDITGSQTKQLWKFRQSLKAALNRLKEVGVLVDWHIHEDDKVHFVKA
jgi:hypothetical protein